MKRIGFLWDEITDFKNLCQAVKNAARGKKKKQEILEFLFRQEYEVLALQREMKEGLYLPQKYHIFYIQDPKRRKICAPRFRDRVVHHAICQVMGTVLEKSFIYDTYACRKDKGTHRAIHRAQNFSRKFTFYLKSDVEKFFDTIDHAILKNLLLKKIKDRQLLSLLFLIIDTAPTEVKGKGLPLGNLTSQYFANLYLNPLDHWIKETLGIPGYVRYMDDVVLFDQDKKKLHNVRTDMEHFLQDSLAIRLKANATFLHPTWQGIPFLGFRVFPGLLKLQREAWRRFCHKIRKRRIQLASREIELPEFVCSVESLIGHIKQGNTWNLRKYFLEKYCLDFENRVL